MTDFPDPLTPFDCDLRGLEYMPLLGGHLFGSEFNARATDSEWRAALTLWWAAWCQVPAASLPDDDAALCRFADLGRDLKTWRKLRAGALHGWIKCADGRLYHPLLAKQALIAWDKRVKERERKAAWRAKKEGRNADVPRDKAVTSLENDTGQKQGQDGQVPADVTRRDGTIKKEEDSVTNVTAANRNSDKQFWDTAKAYLGPGKASLVGKWVRDHGKAETAAAITAAQLERPVNPVEFIVGTLRKRGRGRAVDDDTPEMPAFA